MSSTIRITPVISLRGEVTVPADKSISHRAVMLGSLASGTTVVRNCLASKDVLSTISAFGQMGVRIDRRAEEVIIDGRGLRGLRPCAEEIYVGNSGTTMRLLMGILAAQPFSTVLTADESLSRRPMDRVTLPLRLMGASIGGPHDGMRAPVTITGGKLTGISYRSPVASAQVKSALMFAGLYAQGETVVTEPTKSRDHSERMFVFFGAPVAEEGTTVRVRSCQQIGARQITVPADISSAAFFLAAGAVVPAAQITLRAVGLNPTRTGILDVLTAMGADITIGPCAVQGPEPVADITVRAGALRATVIGEDMMPRLIDELPVLMVVATQARGVTLIKGAGELRVKETDRITSMVTNLTNMGARISVEGDDIAIHGPTRLRGAVCDSYDDHRTAMSVAVAALCAKGTTTIERADIVDISFPGFYELLEGVCVRA